MDEPVDTTTPSTPMWHFLCRVCGMSATIVSTPAGHDAWEDHMLEHDEITNFEAWTWQAMQLFPADGYLSASRPTE